MKPLTMTIDLQISDGSERLAREVLRFGTDDTREFVRNLDSTIVNTALALLIEAQNRQLENAPPVA